MQPNRDENDWQQPPQQPSQAPFVASAPNDLPREPVVTLTPETPATPVEQPLPVASPMQPTSVAQPTVASSEPISETNEPQLEMAEAAITSQETEPVHWQAHEYIHHEKNGLWFVIFTIVVLALMAVAIFLMQSWTFAVLIPVMAIALLVYTNRPPRVLDYTLSQKGLYINDQLFPFSDYKSFGVIHDGAEYSVMLVPVKRFKMGVSVYFPEEAGEAIVDMLGVRLPMQELHLDIVDKLIRKLRI